MLDGRVKTLQPKVHAGILARRDLPEHVATLKKHDIPTIDLVVVNLYPFAATIAKPGCTLEDAIENIDIGGPTMVRSAAKNHAHVAIVTDPADYSDVLAEMQTNKGAVSATPPSFDLAKKAFSHTAAYDQLISNYLTAINSDGSKSDIPGADQFQLRQSAGNALRREPAPERCVLSRPRAAGGRHFRLHPVARQGTLLQQHRRCRCGVGTGQDLRPAGLRHRQARQPVRRGDRRHGAERLQAGLYDRHHFRVRRHHRLQPRTGCRERHADHRQPVRRTHYRAKRFRSCA